MENIYKDLKKSIRKVMWLEVDLEVHKRYYDAQRKQIEELENKIKVQEYTINKLMKDCECTMEDE